MNKITASTQSTPVCPPKRKRKTSNDKSKHSKKRIRTTKSTKTSAQASTTTGPPSRGFWTKYSQEMSAKWSSRIETALDVLPSSSLKRSFQRLAQNSSWRKRVTATFHVNMNSEMTSLPPLPTSSRKTTVAAPQRIDANVVEWKRRQRKLNRARRRIRLRDHKADRKTLRALKNTLLAPKPAKDLAKHPGAPLKPESNSARMIRLYPNRKQWHTVRKWLGTARWTYNRGVEWCRKNGATTKTKLRHAIIAKELYVKENTWVTETPYEIRDGAMLDVLKAYKSNFAKQKKARLQNRDPHKFKLKFRSRRDYSESIVLRASKTFEFRSSEEKAFFDRVRSAEPLPDVLLYDCRLVRNQRGLWLQVPQPRERMPPVQPSRICLDKIAALDPGVRTFQTIIDGLGNVVEWGKGRHLGMLRELRTSDRLIGESKKRHTKHRRRYRLRKAAQRARNRAYNGVTHMHRHLAKFLCENYCEILIPEFQTQQMVQRRRNGRKINKTVARSMMALRHYGFRQHLLHVAAKYGTTVHVVNEAYTSKTCGRCGHLNDKLGGSKVFRCPQDKCGFVCDRDVNGARNIMIRYFTTLPDGERPSPSLVTEEVALSTSIGAFSLRE